MDGWKIKTMHDQRMMAEYSARMERNIRIRNGVIDRCLKRFGWTDRRIARSYHERNREGES